MPGNGPGCTDPDNITEPENCQNQSVVIAAWGSETNVNEDEDSTNLDIFITRTPDKADSWEPVESVLMSIVLDRIAEQPLRADQQDEE